MFVIHKCVAVRHALTAQKMGKQLRLDVFHAAYRLVVIVVAFEGADMISMDGFDCGGHPGRNYVQACIYELSTGDQFCPLVESRRQSHSTAGGFCLTFARRSLSQVRKTWETGCCWRRLRRTEAAEAQDLKKNLALHWHRSYPFPSSQAEARTFQPTLCLREIESKFAPP